MMMLMIGSNDDTREFKAEETASAGSVGLRQSSIAARNTASSPKDEEEQPTVILRRSNMDMENGIVLKIWGQWYTSRVGVLIDT